MMQRKKQPVVTRQAILDAAGGEFASHGYSGTGIGAIVSKAGLTKGALFHHFPDKRALAIAWIGGDLKDAIHALWIAPLDEIDSLNAFRGFCRARCLELLPSDATSALVSLTAETAAADPDMRTSLEDVFATWREAFSSLLEKGKSDGWIHHSIQPAVEAGILVSTFAGLSVTTQCNPAESFRRTCATGLEGYLETLRPQ